tara:strand:- start:4749 stop:5705 length:957 start_codon:yes stop_codon:yes gene_type:complete
MALPYLGLLAVNGVRTIATRLATSPAARKKVEKVITENIKKAKDKALIPTNQTIEKGLTAKQKGLLSDIAKAQPKTPPKPKGRMPIAENIRKVQAAEAERKAAAIAQREAAILADRRKGQMMAAGTGILAATPFLGGEEPMEQAPQQEVVPQPVAQNPRFLQVLNPSYESTSKELLNAAMLRAGLSMVSGGSLRDAVDAAATVGDFETKFRTGQEALAAGRRNLGKDANVYVKQNADGSFEYSGSTEGVSPLLGEFLETGQQQQTQQNIGKGRVITPEIIARFRAVQTNPNITDEELIKSLVERGFVRPTAEVTGGTG